MVKKYPWQRWPDGKKKKQTGYSGQTTAPSWKESSIEGLRREEVKSSKDYAEMAETAPTKSDAATMRGMSEDEARHARNLEKMKQ